MGDVWIVTVSQGLEWIKNPTTLDKIKDFEPWKCDTPAPPPCAASQCKECYCHVHPITHGLDICQKLTCKSTISNETKVRAFNILIVSKQEG